MCSRHLERNAGIEWPREKRVEADFVVNRHAPAQRRATDSSDIGEMLWSKMLGVN